MSQEKKGAIINTLPAPSWAWTDHQAPQENLQDLYAYIKDL